MTRPGQLARRTVVAGGLGTAALLVAGCTDEGQPTRPDPELLLRVRVADEVLVLAELYAAAQAAFPAADRELGRLRAEHEAHADALAPRRLRRALAPTSSSTTSSTPSPSPRPTPTVAPTLPAAREQLADAERAAARRRRRQVGRASPELARLLASVAACEAAHAALLTAGR